ncbi:DnaJ domain-containing protein [Devosia lacusdianchii]|uniref:DnaJ domain-containing protein n=1 Tax=Devosia lacusdianchii TaxID=2917991 RepID=UPI001F05A5EB|nr:DnaJ domain-containing protein [Devosia sp. JXJ CY 41]
MTYVFVGAAVLLAGLAAYQYLRQFDRHSLMQGMRWVVGGGAALLAAGLLFARRIDIAVFVGAAAFSILRTGRLGPFSFDGGAVDAGNISRVKSRYFAMELDHDTGAVAGRVVTGKFSGADLMALGEQDTRALIAEVEWDPDSLSLLESWLDANRSGWREYFAETAAGEAAAAEAATDPLAEAYAVLGLEPGASDEDIRAAHRELMKGVHPDHGGSSYLASKINEARDRLLKR